MKTILNFKWCVLCLFTIGLFSSCLDGENEVQGSGLAYITTVNGLKYAAITEGYFSATGVQNLQLKKYYYIRYKITNPKTSNGIYTGELLDIYNNQEPLDESYMTTGASDIEGVDILDIQLFHRAPDSHLGDGWMFMFQAQKDAKNKLAAHFYYNPEDQYDVDGKDISSEGNRAIIDVLFTETDSKFDAADTYKQQLVVAKLSDFRYEFEPDFSKGGTDETVGKYVTVALKFRFHKEGESSASYFGSWDNTNREYCVMLFTEK